MKITFDIPDSTIVATLLFIFEDENNDMDIATSGVHGDELHDGAVLVWEKPANEGEQTTNETLNVLYEFVAKQTAEIERLEKENIKLRAATEATRR